MIVESYGKGITPLCMLPSGKLVGYKAGNIIIFQNGKVEKSLPILFIKKERIFGRCRFLFRLFRMGIRTALAMDDQHILLSIRNTIYEFNIEDGKLSDGYNCGDGIRPLIFTNVSDISSVEDGIYFGGYLGNKDKKPVHIYKRIARDRWKIVYTFPQGAINHVHAIIADHYRECLWIFTGDFDNAAAIWKVHDNFKKVEYIVGGRQCYRGCVGFAIPEGLLYATDSPFSSNYINLFNTNNLKISNLFPLHGSCIYGEKWNDKYVFSSSVEGDGRNNTRFQFLFGRKKGVGIKDDFVHLYIGDITEGFSEIFKLKKDIMPFYTFQFGVFKFPYGENHTDTLFFQPIATSKNDLNLLALKIKE